MFSDKNSDVTMVITSCGRFDLLKRTLDSFIKYNTYPLRKLIITEDSGDKRIYDLINASFGEFTIEVMLNETKLGLLRSLDKAYQLIETPYIFHCEDDWEFTGPRIIERSKILLENFPKASMILSRHKACTHALSLKGLEEELLGVKYRKINPKCHPEWFGFSFNPGLRRLSDYHVIGHYSSYREEADVSQFYKKQGYFMIILTEGGAKHIGHKRHVNDPFLPARKKTFLGKLKRSFLKRYRRLVARLSQENA